MPRNSQVARRYAQALLNMVESDALLKKAVEELVLFNKVLDQDLTTRKFLLSPVISIADKKEVLKDVSSKLPTIYQFLLSLVRQERVDYLTDITQEFERLVEEKAGELSVEVELASSSMEPSLEGIQNFLQDKWKRRIKIKMKINPDLIGGFVANASGRVFDASVRNQLESLRSSVVS